MTDTKVILIILDGFGYTEHTEHNAIYEANTPNYDSYLDKYPHSLLETSGEAVGLPAGIMGNSEVGHLCIGAGRVIMQDITRINKFAEEKGFESLPDFKRLLDSPKGALHFLGLLSDGGVHSDIEHLFKLVDSVARVAPKKPVFIHVITDGRDTPPESAKNYVALLEKKIAAFSNVKIATVIGRFYAMDRDKRWERVEIAYKALTAGSGSFSSAGAAVEDAYSHGETDEFIKPRLILGGERIKSEDQVVFFNFRADRAREISMAFGLSDFKDFEAKVKIEPKSWVTFTRYREDFPFPILFGPQKHTQILAELIAAHHKKQLRIAETEKYAHVTYFFNGGEEKPFAGEDRVLIPSPREVATYDQKPEMSAETVATEVIDRLKTSVYDFVAINFANGDMVGHTGNEPAAIKAVETLDHCLGRVITVALEKNYEVLITADHGNVEEMVDFETGAPLTSHTTNPVPFIWVGEKALRSELINGKLSDIAPTILEIFGWPKPLEMTGRSLIIDPRILARC